jgi:hypothetical protein
MDDTEVPTTVLGVTREHFVPRLLELTHPILGQGNDGKLDLVGSSLLIRAGQQQYVLTASHVIDSTEGSQLRIGVGSDIHLLRGQISRIATTGATPGTKEDRADVAMIRPDRPLSAEGSKSELSLSAIEFAATPDIRNPVVLLGYPCSKHRKAHQGNSYEAESYALLAAEVDPPEYESLSIDRTTHLALSLDRKDVWQPGGGRTAPNLNGLSGSGVWRLPVYGPEAASTFKLAAVFIEHYQKTSIKHAVATRLTTILGLLARQEPLVRLALGEIGVTVA